MGQSQSSRRRQFAALLFVMVSAASLAACGQKSAGLGDADPLNTASTGPVSLKDAAKLGAAYQADPSDPAKAIAYANALGGIGQTEKQLQILKQVYLNNPTDAKIAAIYGKKLVGAGQGNAAIPVLDPVAASPAADWRIHSALASAYDQAGQFQDAKSQYEKALAKKPGETSVLNNMGMSYILQGDPKSAETILRQAAQSPQSKNEPRIRQNLALAVGLQGRFDEAREIASKDLPADQVEANMEYLRKMMSKSNTWQQLSDGSQDS
jgi:Flp pilus assembly protein TadD